MNRIGAAGPVGTGMNIGAQDVVADDSRGNPPRLMRTGPLPAKSPKHVPPAHFPGPGRVNMKTSRSKQGRVAPPDTTKAEELGQILANKISSQEIYGRKSNNCSVDYLLWVNDVEAVEAYNWKLRDNRYILQRAYLKVDSDDELNWGKRYRYKKNLCRFVMACDAIAIIADMQAYQTLQVNPRTTELVNGSLRQTLPDIYREDALGEQARRSLSSTIE